VIGEEPALDFPLGPALDFLQCLWRLNHALERTSGRMDRRFGVTAQQRVIIRCVGSYPGITAGQLARVLNVDPGTVSAALRRLEDRGLLSRRRDPGDNRRVSLGLTQKGRALSAPTVGTVEAAVEKLLASSARGEIAALEAVVERLTRLLDAELGI
jgi:DNA-binding MarR family transcriptional regulator